MRGWGGLGDFIDWNWGWGGGGGNGGWGVWGFEWDIGDEWEVEGLLDCLRDNVWIGFELSGCLHLI